MTIIQLTGHITEDGKLDEELAELNKPQPPTPFHLIETGVWEDSGITDSVEWIRQQREARAAKLWASISS
jgi:hypothetical protein